MVLSLIVREKEMRMREIMKLMGLNGSIFWIVSYIFNYSLYLVTMLAMWGASYLLGSFPSCVGVPGSSFDDADSKILLLHLQT